MLKAVIFDFDGVISDSEPCHFSAANKVLEDFGIQISEEDYYAEYLSYTDYEMFEAIGEKYKNDYKGLSIEKLIEQKAVFFKEAIRQTDHLIEGIPQFIKKLKKEKMRIAIYSGACLADIKIMLSGSAIENCFDVIVSADDVEKGKPDPEGYLTVLTRINEISDAEISAKQCVVIEDSHWGIVAAKKAGMRVIAVTNSYSADELTEADLRVDSVSRLEISDLHKLCN